jgi:hypothetical protein
MTKIHNSKQFYYVAKGKTNFVYVIGYWNLKFICNLVLVIWDLLSNIPV